MAIRHSSERPRALVFSGAGASCAVNSKNYPTTIQFFERLPSALLGERLVNLLREKCAARFGKGPVDIEKILWSLAEIESFFSAVEDPKSPVNWVCEGNAIQAAVSANYGINEFIHLSRSAKSKVSGLKSEIAAQVYNFYSQEPTADELQDNWILLLQNLHTAGFWIDLVTTNYDLVLETAIDLLQLQVDTGFSNTAVRTLSLAPWRSVMSREDSAFSRDGLLTKLHGSVHWESERKRIVAAGTSYRGSHAMHALISPGFKGAPDQEPFVTFHDYLGDSIATADVVLMIGFAFRDEHINDVIRRHIGHKPIFCIDPSQLEYAPDAIRSNLRPIRHGFDSEAIRNFWNMVDKDTALKLRRQGRQ